MKEPQKIIVSERVRNFLVKETKTQLTFQRIEPSGLSVDIEVWFPTGAPDGVSLIDYIISEWVDMAILRGRKALNEAEADGVVINTNGPEVAAILAAAGVLE